MVAQAGIRPGEGDGTAELQRDDGDEKDQRLREMDEAERHVRQADHGLHPLQHRYVLWYTRKTKGAAAQRTGQNWADSIKRVHEFSTVEGFWGCYVHLKHVAQLPQPCDFHFFKEGIQPLWEDSANKSGGKWILRFKKDIVGRMWELLLLALLGNQLECCESVCGAVLSVRQLEDIISIWNRSAADTQAVNALKDSIKKRLSLPLPYLMEYKPHESALKDQSSFRNTWVRH